MSQFQEPTGLQSFYACGFSPERAIKLDGRLVATPKSLKECADHWMMCNHWACQEAYTRLVKLQQEALNRGVKEKTA